jgi:predicted porin
LPASSEGIALALQVGTGISIGGSHQYGDFIVSYRVNEAFEPYGLFRYVYVKNDPIETRSMRDGSVYVLSPASQYRYAQIMAGARIYLKDTKLYLAVEYSHLLDIANDNLILGEVNLYNAGLGIRF